MIYNLSTPSSKLQIKFEVLQIGTENSGTELSPNEIFFCYFLISEAIAMSFLRLMVNKDSFDGLRSSNV